MERLREKQKGNEGVITMLEEFERVFLFEGAQEYYRGIIPRESEIVLAHNDAQENNILTSLSDNTHIILIDFEYTQWNPRAFDLANYFNETMLDNAYPLGNGIKYYLQNFINERE